MQQVYLLTNTRILELPKATPDTMQKQFTIAICTAERAIVTTIISS